MSSFIRPTTKYASVQAYIENLLISPLKKDLAENERICPWCHGAGLVVRDNQYGLSDDPNKSAGLFPYVHQSLAFCPHCYNGVVNLCALCGEIMPQGRLKHDCEKQREADSIARIAAEKKALDKAEERPADEFGMLFFEGYPYDEGYFTDWDSFFDWWYTDVYEGEERDEDQRPVYVWGTTPCEMSIDANCIVENALDDMYEDASDRISGEHMKALQDYLNEWCGSSGVGYSYSQTNKYKVRIPWEEYDQN